MNHSFMNKKGDERIEIIMIAIEETETEKLIYYVINIT
jgi:hypothetical protein